MNPPKVYLYDLKENEMSTLYFEDGVAVGHRCPICKEQHGLTPIPTNRPGISVSQNPPAPHPPIDYVIMHKTHDMINVAQEKWFDQSSQQILSIVRVLLQDHLENYNIFVFRQFLKDGTCDIGSVGRKGIAKRKTHRKLQAIADNFWHRLDNLKTFW